MDSKSKVIVDQQMSISEIEKRWNCNTDQAVKLFCKALGIRKPNTDKLDAWSKHQLKRCCLNHAHGKEDSCDKHSGGCDDCQSCHGSCNC